MNDPISSASPVGRRILRMLCLTGALFVAALLSGCATTTPVQVDSLAKPGAVAPASASYELQSKNPELSEDSLRFKEAAGFIKTALASKGLYEAPPNTKPDLIVEVDYGVNSPERRVEIVQEPVYRMVPGEPRLQPMQVGVDKEGRPVIAAVLVEGPPSYEFEGYKARRELVISYEKYLRLTARATEAPVEGQPRPEIWTIDVTSAGESRDLRQNLPVLAAATTGYIGKDSKGQQTITIKDTNPDLALIKKGM
jgi:hypothetical protein